MSLPKILVTGATGKTGAAVVEELLLHAMPVRALVHRQDDRSAALARRGVEVVVADLFDPDQLLSALRGVQRAYFLPVFHTHMIQSAVAFALAAREARLEQIVHMSQWLSHRAHPSIVTRQTWLVDHLFADLPGIAHTTINPGMFADNFLRVMDFATLLGIYPIFAPQGRSAPVSNEDMARTVVAALLDPARHDRRRYRPTGPELLSGKDMARIVAKVVGHGVFPVKLPWFLFLRVARQQRINPLLISSLRHYVDELGRGTFELDGGVTPVVEELTGRRAESFETIAQRYAALPFAKVTLGNRLRALINFSLVPVLPGYDIDAWERQVGFPAPPRAALSIDDDRWRDAHHQQMTRAASTGPASTPVVTMLAGATK